MRKSIRALTIVCVYLTSFAANAAEFRVVPQQITLSDAYSRRQVLAEVDQHDVTHLATWKSMTPQIVAVDTSGYVMPVADGDGTIAVSIDGHVREVSVSVSGLRKRRPVDFASEIMPLLSRYGCNSGGCHGKASGQNGFRLSLFGFDTEFDYQAIVQEARGRRVFAADSANSLLLRKAIGATPHGGGKRFDSESETHRLILDWISAGALPADNNAPVVVALTAIPNERILARDEQQQLCVVAEYSDGTTRDVTRQADFDSNLDVVARVDHNGLIQATEQTGEATIMTRFMGRVAVFRAIVPHSRPTSSESNADMATFEPANEIDKLAVVKWKQLDLSPSPVCDDATFHRRVTLDICGRLPNVEDARAFLNDQSPQKRNQLIDRLLDSPDYPAFFAMRWGTILRNSRLAGAEDASYAFHNWLKDRVARNVPYDEFVRGIVAAAGEWQDAPPINWYWQMRDDQLHQVTADTAQVFLGLRLQCARCHHHPYERWGQEDYFGLAGFFTRLGRKSFGQPPPYYSSSKPTTSEKNPLTNLVPLPKFLDGEYGDFSPEQDPRHALVDWMARPENPFFARTLVNRLWGHFMGRGLVHEVDDMRETNPPSNPELLDWLASDFIEHGFDVRRTVRLIVQSRIYHLSSEPTEFNRNDQQNFARFFGRRLPAEVFLDAVDQTTGSKTKFNGVGNSARAVDLPHEGFGSYFLDTFARPRRVSGCECERSSGATLAQVLMLSNSDEMENRIADGNGRIAIALKDNKPPSKIVDELFLAAYSRLPRDDERSKVDDYLKSEVNQQQALQDVMWVVLNSKEFMFNH
ncbi:MAG: DUF1553 domain-containing protein [Planctomycetota bacterium]|nr:DUF1553 domain-containing protein [Planctomycetota bacterium]